MAKSLCCVLAVVLALLLLVSALLEMLAAEPESIPQELQMALNPDGGHIPIPSGAVWLCPVVFDAVASPFGWREHPISGGWSFHGGIDLDAPEGRPIVASRDGTVYYVGYNDSAGNHVILQHDADTSGHAWDSRYLHMCYAVVSAGQTVKQGDIIGYVGETGEATGPHLHFVICRDGRAVDPADYVDFTSPPGETAAPTEETSPTVPEGTILNGSE